MLSTQRDVPGITRAAIPILNSQGIIALSQGVNGASAPPGVPQNSLHFWEDPASGGKLLHWVHAGTAPCSRLTLLGRSGLGNEFRVYGLGFRV